MAKAEVKKLDTYCRACCRQQIKKKKTVTCPMGHDGPVGMSSTELKQRKEAQQANSVKKHIYIQLGNDEDIDVGTFYRIIGSQGQYCLRKYKRSSRMNGEGDEEDFDEVAHTYHSGIRWICEKLLIHELTSTDAITIEQLLEVYKRIENKLDELSETIYLLSDD